MLQRIIALGLVLAALSAPPVLGCETALVLTMDVSGSVNPAEYQLQTEGLAAALRDPQIVDIILQDRVALTVTQWSAKGQQAQVIGWQSPTTPEHIEALAAATLAMPRRYQGDETAVGEALDHALGLLGAQAHCRRKVVDLSGDGAENVGFTATKARQRAQEAGVEVNALAIELMGQAITNYYANWVITKGGFVETARGHLDYARAIRQKLLRELTRPAF